jgi:hydrogenase nickel insertion protein HypA
MLMHETAVAQSLLKTIIEQARKLGSRPLSAKISCGQFNTLNDEIFQFAFAAAAGDTLCRDMKIEITHIPLRAVCGKCGNVFDFSLQSPFCPKCHLDSYQFQPDAPIILEEIEFEDKKTDDL